MDHEVEKQAADLPTNHLVESARRLKMTRALQRGRSRTIGIVAIGTAVLAVAGVAYAAIVTFRQDAISDYIGLQGGPAQLTARTLTTPVGETTGLWHYHPGHVYNVVTQGTITIEDGCGQVNQYSAGQGFETSEGRVHRAYNLGNVDAKEYNMFVGPPNRPIGVNIPDNEHRCGPPSAVEECANFGWTTFNHPAPFADQGACVAYVNHRQRITLLVPEDPEKPIQCFTPDPFVSLGGGTCVNGGWLPPGYPTAGPTPPPTNPPSGGCATPDPFVNLGGGTCVNGGWLPPGYPTAGPTSAPTNSPSGGCATPDPFVNLGGGSCVNGGWVPPRKE